MKKLFSVLLIMFSSQLLQAQWVQITSGTFENLNAVQFPDANTGYAVGNAGVVLKTTNGGQNWTTLSTGSFGTNYSVFFTSATTGFVGTNTTYNSAGGKFLKTTNGGTTWDSITFSNNSSCGNNAINSIYFVSATTGYAALVCLPIQYGDGRLLKTTNGGINWVGFSGNYNNAFSSIYFSNPVTGWFVYQNPNTSNGFHYNISKTSDGGTTWNWCFSEQVRSITSLDFITTTIGYATADSGKIYKTINGGANFTNITTNTNKKLNSIKATDLNKILSVGNNGTIISSVDGGINWSNQTSGTINNLNKIIFINATTGFIVGDVGTILKTTTGGVGITRLESSVPNNYSLSQNYPNPFNPSTKIRFDLPKSSLTKLTIYDITGKVIDELINSELLPGAYEITWDATNNSSGVYFYRIETSGFADMKRMVLVK